MLATFTPDVLTPFSFEVAAEAIEAAIQQALRGAVPSRQAVALGLAKTALETGRWKKIHCYNWGNIKAGEKYAGQYTSFLLNEVLGGKVVWFAPEGQLAGGPGTPVVGQRWDVPPGHPQTRMRAYAGPTDGAYQYIDFVAGGRYVDAWHELLEGDPEGYVHALKLKGYFTADEAIYAKGVKSLFNEFRAKLDGASVPEADVDDAMMSAAMADTIFYNEVERVHELVQDERDVNLRDAGLSDEERKRLGYDDDSGGTDPEPNT